jgi:hypothetical protein
MDALSFSPLTTRQTLLKMIEHEIDPGAGGKARNDLAEDEQSGGQNAD